MRSLRIEVVGTPAPQGSKRAFALKDAAGDYTGRTVVTESTRGVRSWRQDVSGYATLARHSAGLDDPLRGPLHLAITFRLAPPASLSKRRLALGPMRKPDIDKLTRATLDSLTQARVFHDDAQVVDLHAKKVYADPGEPLGASIYVLELAELPAKDPVAAS